jgi:hypothetical protein
MSAETRSFIVWCRQDNQRDVIQVRIIRVDTGSAVHLQENTFLLRISIDETNALERCSIRHIATGDEAFLQAGANLRTFITDHIVQNVEPSADTPDTPTP